MSAKPQVLFVDDEKAVRLSMRQWLELADFEVELHETAMAALERLNPEYPGIVISDVKLPQMDGLQFLERLRAIDPDLPVVLITGHGDIAMAVDAMRRGAYDFIEKPFSPERLVETLRRAADKRRLVMENRRLLLRLSSGSDIAGRLIGTGRAIEELRRDILDLLPTAVPVLVRGETGAGKEMVARCLHDLGPRAAHPFVAINCAAVPEALFEGELMGYERGAFTGAAERRVGRLEYADRGTLFLDEIESMPLALQAKLLRVLQDKVIERLGSNRTIPVDFRVVAATKVDLRAAASAGQFREDLYYRLNVAELVLPPLRERREDIPLLFQHFALEAAQLHGRDALPPDEATLLALQAYDWPGNVRELRNVAERHVLGLKALSGPLAGLDGRGEAAAEGRGSLAASVAAFEKRCIETALGDSQGDVRQTMERLGLPRRTLNEKMERYGIDRRRYLPDQE
ncbi:sigma-54-dependent transcriptional regulator [Ferrovibrio xuzhouensis]|uniref:Sigma-54-dependent transcriptional regulator n=1 Tax=Ferrovibrio xuzhouensis TaxID=1576914 RepID=A0ABV7VN26_9PROT